MQQLPILFLKESFFYLWKKDNNITNYIEEKPKRSTSKNNRKGDTKLMEENQKDFLRSQLEY